MSKAIQSVAPLMCLPTGTLKAGWEQAELSIRVEIHWSVLSAPEGAQFELSTDGLDAVLEADTPGSYLIVGVLREKDGRELLRQQRVIEVEEAEVQPEFFEIGEDALVSDDRQPAPLQFGFLLGELAKGHASHEDHAAFTLWNPEQAGAPVVGGIVHPEYVTRWFEALSAPFGEEGEWEEPEMLTIEGLTECFPDVDLSSLRTQVGGELRIWRASAFAHEEDGSYGIYYLFVSTTRNQAVTLAFELFTELPEDEGDEGEAE